MLFGKVAVVCGRLSPIKGGKSRYYITCRIQMKEGDVVMLHQRGNETATDLRHPQPFQSQYRVLPGIQAQQITGAREMDPLSVAVVLLLV